MTEAATADAADGAPTNRRLPAVAVAGALVVIASLRRGGFYPPDDLRLPAVAGGVAAVAIAVTWRGKAMTRHQWTVVGALLLFALWWYAVAVDHGDWPLARPVVGSAIGFAACFGIGSTIDADLRRRLRDGAVLFGAMTAAVGLVGLALRIAPLALPAEHHLRLAGTLTYSNATGALLAMLAVVTITAPASRFRDAQLVLITGGLIATQSRASLLALALALALVRRHLPTSLVPLILGGLLGLTAVAGSAQARDQPELLGIAALLAGAAAALPTRPVPGRWLAAVAAAAGSVLALTSPGFVDVMRTRVGTASVSDRGYEWRAGWEAFLDSPLTGAGPGNRLQLSDGRTARFVHIEPLQVAADAGLVGVVLLLLAFAAPALRRRGDARVDGAPAVLAAFVVGGLLDFPWHLPAITMAAGLLIGGLPHTSPRQPPAASQSLSGCGSPGSGAGGVEASTSSIVSASSTRWGSSR